MADPSSRRKLTAILSADVVGYSHLMAANEAATIETLKSYRDIIARLVVREWRPSLCLAVQESRGGSLRDGAKITGSAWLRLTVKRVRRSLSPWCKASSLPRARFRG